MAFGMTRHLKYLHPPIAEHVLVAFERLDLASPGQPVAEARLGGLPDLDHFPVALAGEQGRVREIRDLAGMVVMIMADADIGHVARVEADTPQLRDDLLLEEGALRVQSGRAHV